MAKSYRFPHYYVERSNGNCPSEDFFTSLDRTVRGRFIAIMKRIESSPTGQLRNDEKLKKLHGDHAHDLWEMKVYDRGTWYRILCFRKGPGWYWTNGFEKDTNDTQRSEIDKGVRIKKEFEQGLAHAKG